MKYLIPLLIFLSPLPLFAQELPVYEYTVIAQIPWGDGEGELGMVKGIGATHPSHLSFDDKGQIYVADKNNTRINVYTKDMNFLRSIPTHSGILFSPDLIIDSSGAIFGASERNFYKIDPQGNQIYAVPIETFGRFQAHQGYGILFPKNNHPVLVSQEGFLLSHQESKKLLQFFTGEVPFFRSNEHLSDSVLTSLIDSLNTKGLYFAGRTLLAFDFKDYYQLWSTLEINTALPELSDLLDVFLGTDKQGNTYWYFVNPEYTTYFFAVFNPYGRELDRFTVNIAFGQPMISPSGDMYVVYYADYINEAIWVYRLNRRW